MVINIYAQILIYADTKYSFVWKSFPFTKYFLHWNLPVWHFNVIKKPQKLNKDVPEQLNIST
jgi:hypothetical protein